MNWQPIETVPTNGDTIIVFDGFGVCVAAYDDDISYQDFLTICDEGEGEAEWGEYLADNPGMGWVSNECISGDFVYLNPTHWMNLPEPPNAE